MNRSRKELKSDHVVIHLGTNDITYKKTSAPLVIVKYSVVLDSLEKNVSRREATRRRPSSMSIWNPWLRCTLVAMSTLTHGPSCGRQKGHAMKHHYDKSDEKGVHMTESGRELLISSINKTLYPEPANINKSKNSATHNPANDKQIKEQRQRLQSPVKVTLIAS